MNNIVVVIDAGGRGAALVHAYSKSPHVVKILAIPGNDFMQESSEKPVQIYTHLKTTSIKEIVEICKKEQVSLVDVAQDNAVAAGLSDALQKEGILALGPTKIAGELEWSKAFSREFMQRHNIPQPGFHVFERSEDGISFLKNQPDQPWFVKASGLAEGKGALPAKNNKEAEERIRQLQKFGESAHTFLLEKWLQSEGGLAEEFSSFAISDGKEFKIVGSAQDHKRVFDGDKGENTGGMGCSTPPLVLTEDIMEQVKDIFTKTFAGLTEEKRIYKGILYLGGIIVREKGKREKVYVIEYNARWGDPEAEVIVPSIKTDFFTLGMAVAMGNMASIDIATDTKARVAVAGVSKGYPGDYSAVKGKEVIGLEKVKKIPDVLVYGAGIKKSVKGEREKKQEENTRYVANGGRVFYIVGEGKNVLQAREKAYAAIKQVSIEGNNLHYRSDIGWRDVERVQNSKFKTQK